jgi:deoxyribodipyrimidine photolyase
MEGVFAGAYLQHSLGFDKTGPYRAKFLLECVDNLRQRLRDCGSDLIIRMGKPEEVRSGGHSDMELTQVELTALTWVGTPKVEGSRLRQVPCAIVDMVPSHHVLVSIKAASSGWTDVMI